jgi:hypothetical protein
LAHSESEPPNITYFPEWLIDILKLQLNVSFSEVPFGLLRIPSNLRELREELFECGEMSELTSSSGKIPIIPVSWGLYRQKGGDDGKNGVTLLP